MANRFLDTNYYKSPFVRGLKGALKSLYSFIICDCDGAGIWNLDLDAASLYIGFEISMLEFEDCFVKKGKAIAIGGNKFFFPDFIEHQYPSGLQEKNTAHKNFIKTLKKFNLIDNELIVKNKGALMGLYSLIGNGNGNGALNIDYVFEKKEQAIGSSLVQTCANKAWSDQKWRENICMGNSLTENQLKKWMGNYNASICNDYFEKFDENTYKKLFRGWLQRQVGKGYNVDEIKIETKVDSLRKM